MPIQCLIPATSRTLGAEVGIPGSSPQQAVAVGVKCRVIPCCQRGLMGPDVRNQFSSPECAQAYACTGGLSWYQITRIVPPICHWHTTLSSTNAESRIPPMGSQSRNPGTMPWNLQHQGKLISQPPACQNHEAYAVYTGHSPTRSIL